MKKPNGCVQALIVLLVLVLIGFGAIFIWFSRLFAKMNIDDESRYEEEYDKKDIQRFDLFPKSIPESATDVEFLASSGLQSHEGGFFLRMTLPEDEFNSLIEGYEFTTIEDAEKYPIYIREHAQDGFEIYYDVRPGRGIVIDRDSCWIYYFYDEYTCGNE